MTGAPGISVHHGTRNPTQTAAERADAGICNPIITLPGGRPGASPDTTPGGEP